MKYLGAQIIILLFFMSYAEASDYMKYYDADGHLMYGKIHYYRYPSGYFTNMDKDYGHYPQGGVAYRSKRYNYNVSDLYPVDNDIDYYYDYGSMLNNHNYYYHSADNDIEYYQGYDASNEDSIVSVEKYPLYLEDF